MNGALSTVTDELKLALSVLKAWHEPGSNPSYHVNMRSNVRQYMPELARALDEWEYRHYGL